MPDDDVRVPAGWYPDPLGLPQLRWWDNHAWTEHTSDARQPMVADTQAEPRVAPQSMPAQPMQQATRPETHRPRLAFADDFIDPADLAVPLHDLIEPSTTTGLTDLPSRRVLRDAERHADDGPAREAGGEGLPFAEARQQLEAPPLGGPIGAEPSPAMRYARGAGIQDAPTSARYDLEEEHEDLLGEPTVPRSAFDHATSSTTTFIPDYPTEHHPEASRTRAGHRIRQSDLPRTSTGPVWVMTLIPAYVLLAGLLVLLSGAPASFAQITAVLVLGVPWIAGIVLAIIDHRMLKSSGMEVPAHWAWSILGIPVYLVARLVATVREAGNGFGPVLTHFGLSLFVLGAVVAVPGLIMELSPGVFAVEAERSVVSDARSIGADLRVDCPETPPLLVQQSFVCAGVNDDGEQFDITVSLQRANGWIDWRVDDWGVFTMRP